MKFSRKLHMKNKTKHQFIKAAGIVFERYGFKKTTMDDIAYAAGKGKSSIYYYFKNKEEIFEAVTHHEAELVQEQINLSINKLNSATEKFRMYVTLRMKRFVAKGVLITALNDNFMATFSFIEKIRDNYRNWEINSIAKILAEGIKNKEFKPRKDIFFAAEAILTCMIGFEIPLLTKENTPEESENKINEILEMFLYGIENNQSLS